MFSGVTIDTVIFCDFITVPNVAETIAHPDMVGDVVNGNAPLMEPAGTVTEAGIPKLVLVDFKTTADALAAAEVKVTVHVPPRPGATVVGEQVRRESEDGTAAVMVRVAVLLEPLRVAVTVGVWLEVTAAAVAIKVAVVAAEATVTEAGTVKAEVLLLERSTTEPPEGAAFERVTVQVVVARIARVVLAHCRDVGVATVTSDKLEVALTPFSVALAVAV